MKKAPLIAAVSVLAATLVLNYLVPEPVQQSPFGQRISGKIPFQIGEWSSVRDLPVSEDAKRVLGTDDILHRYYNRKNEPTDVLLTLIFSGGHRHSMHPPEVCYQSQGYKLIGRSTTALLEDLDATVLKLSGSDGETLVNYWFFSEGRETANYMWHQVHLILNQVMFSTQPSVLLRFSTKILNQDIDAAQERIGALTKEAVPILREQLQSPTSES